MQIHGFSQECIIVTTGGKYKLLESTIIIPQLYCGPPWEDEYINTCILTMIKRRKRIVSPYSEGWRVLELEGMQIRLNVMNRCGGIPMLFGAQIKPLQLVIIIYSNQAEEFDSTVFIVDISHVDGDQVAFGTVMSRQGNK